MIGLLACLLARSNATRMAAGSKVFIFERAQTDVQALSFEVKVQRTRKTIDCFDMVARCFVAGSFFYYNTKTTLACCRKATEFLASLCHRQSLNIALR